MVTSPNAIRELVARNDKMERQRKLDRVMGEVTEEKLIGFGVATVSSVVAGYLDGRFDLANKSDAGDGITVVGLPVMPMAAGALMATGLMVGGKVGAQLGFAGLGVICGYGYGRGNVAGEKDQS